jgi:putative addiction module component (TIGR02574 family)
MANDPVSEILKLPVAERIRAVQEIWDSIADDSDNVPLTDEERAELDRRLEEYYRDPKAGAPWEEVRDRIRRNIK